MDKLSMKYTGKIIKELREKSGESQEQLAAALNAPNRETITRWENGSRDLKREHIIAIAKHFDVSADYLLGLSQSSPKAADTQSIYKATKLSDKAISNLKKFLEFDFAGCSGDLSKESIYNKFFEHPILRAVLDDVVDLINTADAYKLAFLTNNVDTKNQMKYEWRKMYIISKYSAEESFKFLYNQLIEDITGLNVTDIYNQTNDFNFYMKGENHAEHNSTSE